MIEFQAVSGGYPDRKVLREISFSVAKGSLTALIGPNGCGKTTLLRTAARRLSASGGRILLEGRPIEEYGRKEFARTAAFLPQNRSVPGITVRALVSHGRFPYLGFSRRLRAADRAAVRRALEITATGDWAERDLRELSGGERQRVYLAMALAQDTGTILLDEPTAFLDLYRQFELLELLRRLCDEGKAILIVLHDLALALQYSDQLVLLEQGRMAAVGTPEQIVAQGALDRVFRVQTHRAEGGYWFSPAQREGQKGSLEDGGTEKNLD